MKTLNYFFRLSFCFAIILLISGCGKTPITKSPIEDMPDKPPCAIYDYGTVVFTNISNHNFLLNMNYNREKSISARSQKTITKITSNSYQWRYKGLNKRKGKSGAITFDVCPCETTYITLPSKGYYRCEMSP